MTTARRTWCLFIPKLQVLDLLLRHRPGRRKDLRETRNIDGITLSTEAVGVDCGLGRCWESNDRVCLHVNMSA